jgi:carboxylate-amine ligase
MPGTGWQRLHEERRPQRIVKIARDRHRARRQARRRLGAARPHPRLGTVELRIPDAQAEPDYAVALAALTQCLVATADDYAPEDARYVSENKWRAIRRGAGARFYDFSRREEKGAREVAHDLVARLRPISQNLGCEAELGGILEILDRGTGAEMQRAAYERRGALENVVDYLLRTTAPI